MFDLTGRKALVTGATGGIGEEIARQLHAQGAIVGLHGTRVEKLEALAAELGERVKIFPANVGGPDYIKAVRGPLPQVQMVPTGGVELHNVGDFLKAGAVAFGVGGNLVSKKLLAARDFAGLTENAKTFAAAVAAVK